MSRADRESLDPMPASWFAVAFSRDLPPGSERRGVLATTPYRLRRARDGRLSLAWTNGDAALLAEQNGVVLAWHHPQRAAPGFRVPLLPEEGFTPPELTLLRARSHPQETFENSIDVAHFPMIHGYTDIEVLQPMRTQGHELSVRYQIARESPIPLLPKLPARFEVRLHGLGCAHNHIEVPAIGLRVRMLALSTPTELGQVEIRLAVSAAKDSLLPFSRALAPLVRKGAAWAIRHDFQQDMHVWEHKRFVGPALLVSGDGPIGAFRKWCRQFYPASGHAQGAVREDVRGS